MVETHRSPAATEWWERFGALAGVLAVALWIIGVFVLESGTPATDDTPAKILAEFDDNFGPIAAGGVLFAIGTLFFVWFLGILRAHLLHAEGLHGRLTAIMFGSGIAKAVFDLGVVGSTVTGALAADEGNLTPEAAQALAWMSTTFFIGAEFMAVPLLVAAAVVILRTRVLPVWLAWLALVISLGLLIVPIGWAFLLIGVPVWVLLASVLLFMRTSRTPPQPA